MLKALTLARKHGARTALDIDYRPNLWGVAGHGEGESRFVESAEVTAQAAVDAALLRPDRRHRGGVPHRRRHRPTPSPRCAPCAPSPTRRSSASAAPRAPSPSKARSRRASTTARPAPASRSRSSTCSAPATASSPACSGAGSPARTGRPPQVRQRLRRLRGLPPRLHPGLSLARRARVLPRAAASSAPTCATTRRSSRCTGRPTASASMAATGRRCGSSPSTTGCSSRRWPAPRPRRSAPSSSSASGPRCRSQDGRPGYGILCDSRLGRAALHAASGTGLWIGRPCEWPGSRPLTLEPELGSDYGGLVEWAREDVVKVLCFCHPDDTPEMRAAAGGDGQAALGGLAPQPARVPARDHPVEGRRRWTTTPPRR